MKKRQSLFFLILSVTFYCDAQVFIPHSFWQDMTPCKSGYCPTPSPTVAALLGSAGMTPIVTANADDANLLILLPFNFAINNIGYRNWYVSSNTYYTAGTGSNLYSALSSTVPAFPKFHLGSADNSWQLVWTLAGTNFFRIRYEGTNATGGTVGSPNITYEFTFYRPAGFATQYAVVVFGGHARPAGQFGIANSSTYYINNTSTTGTPAGPGPGVVANTSYLFSSNNGGVTWTIQQGWSIAGVGTTL